jgi:hypothetical protein
MSWADTEDRGVTEANSTTFENRPFDMLTPRWSSEVTLNEQMEAMQQHQGLDNDNGFEVFGLLRRDQT